MSILDRLPSWQPTAAELLRMREEYMRPTRVGDVETILTAIMRIETRLERIEALVQKSKEE